MSDTQQLAPQEDKDFIALSPEDKHAYLSDTDPDYRSLSPEDQKAYVQHVVTEHAKSNIAQYPENQPQGVMDKIKNVAGKADEAITGALAPNPTNYGSAVKTNIVEAPKTLAREVYSGAKTAAGLIPGMYHAFADEATPEEKAAQSQFEQEHGEAPGTETSGFKRIGLGVQRMSGVPAAEEAAKTYANPATRPSYEQVLENAPEALGQGAGTVAGFKGLEEGVPAASRVISPKIKTAVAPVVRMAGRGVEAATTPVVAGGAAGGYLSGKFGGNVPMGAEAGAALGAGMAQSAGISPIEPLLRVPRMTRFGLEEPVNSGAPLLENPADALGRTNTPAATPEAQVPGQELGGKEAPENPALKTLKSAYDKANSAYQKAYEAREAYRASIDQGVEPPAAVTKAFEKAQKALDEAQFHYETALEKGKPAAAPEPELQPTPTVPRAGQQKLANEGGVMGKPLQLKGEVAPEPQGPKNVKGPGEVAPETETPTAVRMRRAQEAESEPIGVPQIRGGQQTLANEAGVMGKPLQLPGEVAGEVPKMSKTVDQVKKIGDLTREGLGGKELERNKPLREQVPVPAPIPTVEKVEGEVLPPEKPQVSQNEKAAESLAPFFEQEPIEGETEHPVPQVRANGENLANAIPKTPEGHDLLQKLHDLTNVELRQLAINAGEDMGQKSIGRGKNSGSISRPEVFDRLLKNHSPDDLGKMVDEGKHLPTVGGGATPAAGLERTPEGAAKIAEETKAKDLGPAGSEARARAALGPNASDADVKNLMAEMQKEIYTGPERRATPRTAPLGAKELEEAIKGRKAVGVKTPFDVTEGAKATIEADKAMPKQSVEQAASAQITAHNTNGGSTFDINGKDLGSENKWAVGSYPELTEQIKGDLSEKDLNTFKEKNKEILNQPDHAVGTWKDPDTGNSVLDVTKLVADKDAAVKAGKDANQKSIYHLKDGVLLDTGGTGEAKPVATMDTARMSDAELEKAGFTKEQIENGEHLPSVSGAANTRAASEAMAKEHLGKGEEFKSESGRERFIQNLMKAPSVQEFADIAKAGETGKDWYTRSVKAFDALVQSAPRYFQEGDRQKFTNFLASLSPQQSVKMNLQEALHTWSKYVDMGRPEGKPLENMLKKELTIKGSKVPNAMKALAGEDLWPTLDKNEYFKVPSFAENLKGFMDKVTSDGWQAAFAGLDAKALKSAQSYHPLSVLTRAAAKQLGWEPAQAQAAIWAFTKMLTEKGEAEPESVVKYSEDFADLMAHDQDIRRQLSDLGIDTGELDEHLKQIERKPEVTAGASPTTENSIGKLASRLEKQRGKLPQPKDSGLFERTEANERESFFKPISSKAQAARMNR
jgi:hypothetical protein